jgi:hypothetical protein
MPRVLAGDGRIEPAQPRQHGLDLAEQEAEGVDEVDRRLVDEEALHLLEVGLPVEIGARSLAVAGT